MKTNYHLSNFLTKLQVLQVLIEASVVVSGEIVRSASGFQYSPNLSPRLGKAGGRGAVAGPTAICTPFVMAVLCSFMLSFGSFAHAQEAASKAYEKAYNYILDEKWSDAQTALGAFIEKYPKSKLVD